MMLAAVGLSNSLSALLGPAPELESNRLLRSMLKKRPRRPRCSLPPAADVFLLLLRLGLLSSLRRG
jgi:hypothetical protein